MKGFVKKIDKETGKKDVMITSYFVEYIYQNYESDTWLEHYSDDPRPPARRRIEEFIQIPCGRCVGCRQDYAREWADRCLLELQDHKSSYFVTLTYDDAHIHYVRQEPDEDGVYKYLPTLCRRDLQLFMKRLRERTGQKIRYYGCGEYGPKTCRPHYHMILFGLELPSGDLKFYKKQLDYQLYESELLTSVWQNGFVVVGQVTYETCAYTARYIGKKVYGSVARDTEDYGIAFPFSCMSLRPGIGYNYYLLHNSIVDHPVNVPTVRGGHEVYSPRYFNRMFDVEFPEEAEKIKERKQYFAQQREILKDMQTSLGYLERLRVEEAHKIKQLQRLSRKEL